MGKFNPFAPLSKEDKERKEKEVADAVKKLQMVKDAARVCLKLEQFAIYKEKLEKAEQTLTDLTLVIDMQDPKELWKLQSLQSELRAIRGIMTVEKDAR
jgi:hypothetical protein